MKQIIWFLFHVVISNWSSAFYLSYHNCLPGTVGMCILDKIFYNQSQDTTYVFPENHPHIRIKNDPYLKGIKTIIKHLDSELYRALGEPKILEIVGSQMETLQIPRELELGNFFNNWLERFWLESSNMEPKLTYLDLGRNRLTSLSNITGLVHLEALDMSSNAITILETSVFYNLTKLKFLNLNYNAIHRIVGDQLPQSLAYLGLYQNSLKTLNFTSLQLASLEELNVEANRLESFDASALIVAMPKLKMVRLVRNEFDRDTVLAVIGTLRRHNVRHRNEGDEEFCDDDEEEIDIFCVKRNS